MVEKNEKEEVQEEKIEIKVDNDVDIAKEAEKAEVTIDATELVVKVEKPKPVKKEKKKLIKRKPRKDLFEDLDVCNIFTGWFINEYYLAQPHISCVKILWFNVTWSKS